MIDGIRVEVGNKRHRAVLEGFTCCAPHVPVAGLRGLRCQEPWAHGLQTDIRRDLLPRAGAHRLSHDYRLLLLFDGDALVAVAGHEQLSPAQMTTRYIDLVAVHTDLRGQRLSNGKRCSETALQMVLDDIIARTPLVKVIQSDVDHRNIASIRYLTRTGALIGTEVVNGLRPVVRLPW
ncbi:hypothetical protein [Geodermatophilus sp. URMC 63]